MQDDSKPQPQWTRGDRGVPIEPRRRLTPEVLKAAVLAAIKSVNTSCDDVLPEDEVLETVAARPSAPH